MLIRFICALAVSVGACAAFAGPLNPPAGPIVPTPGPEPRTAINAANTPGDADSTFHIAQSGSYYLAGDVTGSAGKIGIELDSAARQVTIDLNGFTLRGVVGSLDGIGNSGGGFLTVVNGSIVEWGRHGVNAATRIDRLRVANNARRGVQVMSGSIVSNCIVTGNGAAGSYGIEAGTSSSIVDCIVVGNGGNSGGGIAAEVNSRIARCTVTANARTGGVDAGGHGITTGTDCVITDCRVDNNGSSAAIGSGGINASVGTSVLRCTLYANLNAGIRSDGEGTIADNTVGGTSGTIGAGILVTGSRTRVQANHMFSNSIGLRVASSNNVVIGNSARTNATNFDIVGVNDVGPITTAAAAVAPTSNFQGP